MTTILKAAAWCLAGYGMFCLMGFVFQRQVIFPRYYAGPVPNRQPDLPGLEIRWLQTSFGRIEAWLLRPAMHRRDDAPMPMILFAHGNAETIDSCAAELLPFTEVGYALLLVEFPGYGRSAGRPSQKRILEGMQAAYDWAVTRRDIDAGRVVLMGRSLGGGVVCALADQRDSAALILLSTFTSLKAMARKFAFPGFLVRDAFDNLSTLSRYPNPVLIMHGRHDEIVPYRHGVRLHQAAANSDMISYECGHNDLPPDPAVFWIDIQNFLKKVSALWI